MEVADSLTRTGRTREGSRTLIHLGCWMERKLCWIQLFDGITISSAYEGQDLKWMKNQTELGRIHVGITRLLMTFHEWDRKTSAFFISLLRAASVFFIALTRVLLTIIRLFHSFTTLVVLYISISFLKSSTNFFIQVGSLSNSDKAMSVKRSRLGESSNFIEKDLLNHMSLTVESAREVGSAAPSSGERKPPKCLRPSVDEGTKEQSRQNVILKSPARASKSCGLGDFLKYCKFCSKKIQQDKDVFMYRDYCAYCSEKCRGYQIELDEMVEKQLAESRAADQDQDMNNLMSGFY